MLYTHQKLQKVWFRKLCTQLEKSQALVRPITKEAALDSGQKPSPLTALFGMHGCICQTSMSFFLGFIDLHLICFLLSTIMKFLSFIILLVDAESEPFNASYIFQFI